MESKVPFVINDNDLWIESGGTSNQNSTNAYTSFKDDSRLGDTNGDGDASTPSAGDWERIYDDSMVIPSPYFYSWSNIYYDSY